MKELAVVIVNFNAGEALEETLSSLAPGLEGFDWEAVVVDNASNDGSERHAERAGDRVALRRMGANAGFARGVNAGIAASSAPLVLILNPDCRLVPGAVKALTDVLAAHADAAIVGPRILNADGTLQESARGDPTLLTGLFGRTSRLSRWFPDLAIVKRNLAAERAVAAGLPSVPVDWVSGAAMLARREALAAVGGFDEGYFLYWEDADLCRRLRDAGWLTRYVPAATVVHHVGQSSRHARALAIEAFHDSAYRYYVTHVIPQRWHPGRLLARAVLSLRCTIKQTVR
ncbi:MAG: glycosyltransferase family 2 protein [Acidobacteriota bacterium]